jgi:hypothetical protein
MSLFKRISLTKTLRVPILILFLLLVVVSSWKSPSATPVLGIALIVVSLAIAFFFVFRKHRMAYLEGKLTRAAFVRNTCLDVFGILLAVALAGLLGRYVAGVVAMPIRNDLIRLLAGVIIGLLVGAGVGTLVFRLWGRFIKLSPETL